MDMPWGEDKSKQFITNVGIVSTKGKRGYNIMACEWTHLLSYKPGIVAVAIGPGKATNENISESKEFGVSLAAVDQANLSSISGLSHGQGYDKVKIAEEYGFKFHKGKKVDVMMPEGVSLAMECKLINKMEIGDHTLFIGEILEATADTSKDSLGYHKVSYGRIISDIPKPSQEERAKLMAVGEKHKRN